MNSVALREKEKARGGGVVTRERCAIVLGVRGTGSGDGIGNGNGDVNVNENRNGLALLRPWALGWRGRAANR